MDITEVSKASGLPASTLRFYEEKGLITSIGRHGLRRVFSAQVIEQLALIALGRESGFSLEEIGSMLGTHGNPNIDPTLLSKKAEDLDKTIQRLTAMRDGLRHAAVCSAPSHMACPKFRRLMALAAARASKHPEKKQNGKKHPEKPSYS